MKKIYISNIILVSIGVLIMTGCNRTNNTSNSEISKPITESTSIINTSNEVVDTEDENSEIEIIENENSEIEIIENETQETETEIETEIETETDETIESSEEVIENEEVPLEITEENKTAIKKFFDVCIEELDIEIEEKEEQDGVYRYKVRDKVKNDIFYVKEYRDTNEFMTNYAFIKYANTRKELVAELSKPWLNAYADCLCFNNMSEIYNYDDISEDIYKAQLEKKVYSWVIIVKDSITKQQLENLSKVLTLDGNYLVYKVQEEDYNNIKENIEKIINLEDVYNYVYNIKAILKKSIVQGEVVQEVFKDDN